MIQVISESALLILVHASIWFVISLIQKRNDVADIGWGTGFVTVCGYLFFTQPHTPIALGIYTLVTLCIGNETSLPPLSIK